MKMASSLGMVEADPAPGPRIGVRGRLFVGDSSGRHDGAAGCYFQSNLHTNDLSGDIPSALGRLFNLTRLRIAGVDGNPGNTNSP